MKSAFAKLLEKNPTQSSQIAFRAGGNGVPILTRASGQSTTGYQTMGLPDGSKPMPGGGANKTVLGAYRMGDDDGNAAIGAIYPGEIFPPIGAPIRTYPERNFTTTGNNVFQPETNDLATHALLKRLGDQQFKAQSQAPFEDYRAQQRLARDLEEASRNASLSDLGTSREIIRNLAAQRRQQNEDDYLRKMLDAGATPEAARKEIEDVRNAHAIQEAKKVDDREYQAKTLIQRIAMARGVTPMTREPLNQSSSIDNPQRSQAMSQAMGMPGEGFGTSPLDMNRQFMTPDFYRKYLRKNNMSQESIDEQAAFNTRLAENEIPLPSSGAFSLATLRGQERQLQIENASEALASRLETIRSRANRILLPLPRNTVGKQILDDIYKEKGEKKPGNKVLSASETIEDMKNLQLLITLNLLTVALPNGYNKLNNILKQYTWGSEDRPSDTLIDDLKKVIIEMNGGELNVRIPYASVLKPVSNKQLFNILQNIKTNVSSALEKEITAAHKEYSVFLREINPDEIPLEAGEPITLRRNVQQPQGLSSNEIIAQAVRDRDQKMAATNIQRVVRGRQVRNPRVVKDTIELVGPGEAAGDQYTGMNKTQLKEIMKARKITIGKKSVDELRAALRASDAGRPVVDRTKP
jgi:hypothetical protein